MRVALAGVGHWHVPMHLDAVRAAGAAVAGVWDFDAGVATRFAAGAGVTAATDYGTLLAARPALVLVMGHPAQLPDIARACLAAGLPMVLETPVAPSTEALATIAPGPCCFVAVPFANRCSPLWAEFHRLRDACWSGALTHAHFRVVNGPSARHRTDGVAWLPDPAVSGGGAPRNAAHGEAAEDYDVATIGVPGGPVITVEAGYTYASMEAGGDFGWRVVTAGATLIRPWRCSKCRHALRWRRPRPRSADRRRALSRFHGGHARAPAPRCRPAGRVRRLLARHAPRGPHLPGGRTMIGIGIARAGHFAAAHGGHPCGDWRRLLDDPEVKVVLVEKPMAPSLADCTAMTRAAAEAGCIFWSRS